MSQPQPSAAEPDRLELHGFRNRIGRMIEVVHVLFGRLMRWMGKAVDRSARAMRPITRLMPKHFPFKGLASTLVLLIFLLILLETIRPPSVKFEGILVPGELIEMGYTPQTVAERLIDAAIFFRANTRSPLADPTSMAHVTRNVDLELGALGISFNSIVAFARAITGRNLHIVTGEILRHGASDRVSLRLRIDGHKVFDGSARFTHESIEALLSEGAHALVKQIDPSAVALHHSTRGEGESAGEVVAFMLERASSSDEYAQAFFVLGTVHLMGEEFDEATRAYNRAIEFDPGFSAAYGARGVALAEQGKVESAIESFRKSTDIHPDSAPVQYNWGKALFECGDFIGAIERFRRAVRADPRFADAHYNWGLALEKQGDSEGAINQYRRAVHADPRNASAHNNWGLKLAEQGDIEGAIEQYRRAVWADPRNAKAHFNWGNLLNRRGDIEGAVEQYSRALRADPDHSYARINLGNLLLQRGDAAGAIEQYSRVVLADPDHADAHFNWGLVLVEQGDFEGAITRFERAVQANSTDSAAYNAWAILLANLGDCEGAAEKFREAKTLDDSLIEPTCEISARVPLEINSTGALGRSLNQP